MEVAKILQLVGESSSGLFAGAALYISLTQHPSLSETLKSNELPVHFKSFYPRAAKAQASLAVISAVSLIASYFFKPDLWTLVPGLLMGSIFPWTLLFMMPVNNQFMDATPGSSRSVPFSKLFATWGKLHWYRTTASVVAFMMLVFNRK